MEIWLKAADHFRTRSGAPQSRPRYSSALGLSHWGDSTFYCGGSRRAWLHRGHRER